MSCSDVDMCNMDNKHYYENIVKCLSSDKDGKEALSKEDTWIQVQAANYFLLNGILYYDKRKPRTVILEESIQSDILQKLHIEDGTHIGVKKMHEQLKKHYFWRYCYKSISLYVQNCPTCGLKGHQETRSLCSSSKTPSPWANIELYILSPEMRDNHDQKHLAVLFDPISYWISASAISPDPSNVAEFVFENIANFGFFYCCTFHDVSQTQYEEVVSEFFKLINDGANIKADEIKILNSDANSASHNDWLKSVIDLYLKEHPNDWWHHSTLLLWLWKIRNTAPSGRSPMEFMNFARQRKSDSLKKCSKAAARKSIAVMDKQSSESVVNLNIHDSASASKFSNHVNDPRRSSRQARQRITVNQPVEAADQRLLLAGSTFEAVREFISKSKEQKAKGERKKRGEYHRYTPEVREAIAKHAIENGIRDASKSYSSSLGFLVSYSTVRNFIRSYHAFCPQTKEEIGRYATECGIEAARKHYTEKLGKPMSAAFIRKFRRLYLRGARNSQVSRTMGSAGQAKTVRNLYCTSVREEIGKYAFTHGVQAAVRHFSEKLQFKVKESTVRKYKKLYARSSQAPSNANQQLRVLPTAAQQISESSSQNVFHSQIPEQSYYVQNYSHYPVSQYGCHATSNYSICASQPYGLNQPVPPYPSFSALPPPPQYQPSSAQLPAYSRHWNTTSGTQENSSETNPAPAAVEPNIACYDTPVPSTSGGIIRKGITKTHTSSLANSGRDVKKVASRGRYASYSPDTRLQIGQFAAAHGSLEAIAYFKQKLGHEIPESTIRTLRDKFIHHSRNCEVDSASRDASQRGRPYRLGAYDAVVQECLRQLKRAGEPVNMFVTIATARQVLLDKEPTLLEENGGPVKLTKYWAKSFLRRAGINKQAHSLDLPAEDHSD